MELKLECKVRPENSKPNALRRSGWVPAVLYGHNGTESLTLVVKAKAAELLVRDATVNNTLIQVSIPEKSWNGQTLLREIQSHPWKTNLYHLSFFSVASQTSLTVNVPLRLVGSAPGLVQGGNLDQVLTELQVECAPGNIPEQIEVDVSGLKVGDALQVHQLILPAGVQFVGEPDRVVVSMLHGSGTDAATTPEEPV